MQGAALQRSLQGFGTRPRMVLPRAACSRWPAWAGGLDKVTSRGPFQPQPFSASLGASPGLWVTEGSRRGDNAFYPHWHFFTLSCPRLPLHNPVPLFPSGSCSDVQPLRSLSALQCLPCRWTHQEFPLRHGKQRKTSWNFVSQRHFGDIHGETVRKETLKSKQ